MKIGNMEKNTFKDFGLSHAMLQSLDRMRFTTATPVQSKAIDPMMQRKDLLVQAPTGTGKTCAFGIPIIETLDVRNQSVQSLVLSPTRELAIQTAKVLTRLSGSFPGVKIATVYGGERIERQLAVLRRRPHVIVATPGRMVDFLHRRAVRLDHLNLVVLDEADRMLDMGFRDELNEILSQTPDEKQTVLFSATIPHEVMKIAKTYQKDALQIEIEQETLTVESIEQFYTELKGRSKMPALVELLSEKKFRSSLVFAATKSMTDTLADHLVENGFKAAALHGDLRQSQRDAVMNRYRNGQLEVLVATDVASRGIDVKNIDAVINYDIPQDIDSYIHRIGRTGRAEQTGLAYTFISPKERSKLRAIMAVTKAVISPIKVGPADETDFDRGYGRRIDRDYNGRGTRVSAGGYCRSNAKVSDGGYNRGNDKGNDRGRSRNFERSIGQSSGTGNKLTTTKAEVPIEWDATDSAAKVKMFISLGELDQLTKKDLVSMICTCCQTVDSNVGSVSMMKAYSFFEVAPANVQAVLSAFKNKAHRNRAIRVEVAENATRIRSKHTRTRPRAGQASNLLHNDGSAERESSAQSSVHQDHCAIAL